MTYRIATPQDIKAGSYYYTRSGNSFTRRRVEMRLTADELIRLRVCTPAQREYIHEESEEQCAERLRVIRKFAAEGRLWVK